MLYFKKAAEDAAIFPVSALTSIDCGDQAIDLYFDNGLASGNAINKVELDCADGESANVMKDLALAIAGPGNIHSNVITVRDDIAGTGVAGITAVDTITFDFNTGS